MSTKLRQATLSAQIGELERDVGVYAGTPPLKGIIRALRNNGVDPKDGSTTAEWHDRMSTIFIRTLQNKPEYQQARLILADSGKELLRVHRIDGAVHPTSTEDLQHKGSESYVIDGLKAHEGEVVLSNITLNRENGQIETPHRPMLRATAVVNNASGEPFLLIVINVSVGRLLSDLVRAEDSQSFFVTTTNGEYLAHPSAGVAFQHELGEAPTVFDQRPALAILRDQPLVTTHVDQRRGVVQVVRRVQLGKATGRYLLLFGEQSFTDISSVLWQAAARVVLGGGALMLIAALIALLLGRLAIAPVVRLTDSVKGYDPEGEDLQLPSDLVGEAGELAKVLQAAFHVVQQRTHDLKASNAELEEFAFVATHDLQEPLRTVRSFVDELDRDYIQSLDEDAAEMMGFIKASCGRMSNLIHDVQEYGRVRQETVPEYVQLDDLVQRALADLGSAIEGTGAQVEVGPMPAMTLYAGGVRTLIQNLVSNALKYQRAGVTPRVRITSERSGRGYTLRIIDNGLGIAPEHRERVFRIFQRLHNRDEFDGTGIGLALCRRVVSLHNGQIWIEDGDSGGTTIAAHLEDLAA